MCFKQPIFVWQGVGILIYLPSPTPTTLIFDFSDSKTGLPTLLEELVTPRQDSLHTLGWKKYR